MKVDRSLGAAHVIDTLVGDGFCSHLPLVPMLVLIYKHCPVSQRNNVFSQLAMVYILQVTLIDNVVSCGDGLCRISRSLVDNLEILKVPDGLTVSEKYDLIKVAICDFIYSKFYSMFNKNLYHDV